MFVGISFESAIDAINEVEFTAKYYFIQILVSSGYFELLAGNLGIYKILIRKHYCPLGYRYLLH